MRLRGIAILGVTFMFALPSVAGAYTVEGPSKGITEATQQEAEHKAQEQKEANERAAKAAEEKKATEERQQHEAAEHKETAEPKTKEAEASQCVVPALKGDSPARATAALRKAHCKLGKVSRPHKGKGTLVVVSQKLKPGTKSAAGTAVGVTLGPAKHMHR